MADIKIYGEKNQGIQAPAPEEPYTYEVDVRAFKNLAENDYKLNMELQSMVPKKPIEIPDGKNNIFTFPNEERAAPGSLIVYLNGIAYNPENIILINEYKQFKIINDILPDVYDDFYVVYRINNTILMNSEELEPSSSYTYIGNTKYKPIVKNSFYFYLNGVAIIKDDGEGNLRIINDLNPQSNYVGTIDYILGKYDFVVDFSIFLSSGIDLFDSSNKIHMIYQYFIIP